MVTDVFTYEKLIPIQSEMTQSQITSLPHPKSFSLDVYVFPFIKQMK